MLHEEKCERNESGPSARDNTPAIASVISYPSRASGNGILVLKTTDIVRNQRLVMTLQQSGKGEKCHLLQMVAQMPSELIKINYEYFFTGFKARVYFCPVTVAERAFSRLNRANRTFRLV